MTIHRSIFMICTRSESDCRKIFLAFYSGNLYGVVDFVPHPSLGGFEVKPTIVGPGTWYTSPCTEYGIAMNWDRPGLAVKHSGTHVEEISLFVRDC